MPVPPKHVQGQKTSVRKLTNNDDYPTGWSDKHDSRNGSHVMGYHVLLHDSEGSILFFVSDEHLFRKVARSG